MTKRFTFRLDALKRLATADESLHRIELARREQALRASLDHLDECGRVAETARASLQELIDGGAPSSAQVSRAIRAIDDAAHFVARAASDVETRKQESAEARAALEEHVTRRRVLDRLEQRARREHTIEADREGQREMDEEALQRCEEPTA
jgi:flagellar export protein FliJ